MGDMLARLRGLKSQDVSQSDAAGWEAAGTQSRPAAGFNSSSLKARSVPTLRKYLIVVEL